MPHFSLYVITVFISNSPNDKLIDFKIRKQIDISYEDEYILMWKNYLY